MAFAVLIIVRSLVDQVAARMPAERQGGQSFLRLCLPLGTFPEVGVPLPEDPCWNWCYRPNDDLYWYKKSAVFI